MSFRFVFDVNERSRVTRQLESAGDDERDGLPAENKFLAVKRAKRRAFRRIFVFKSARKPRLRGTVIVRENLYDASNRSARLASIFAIRPLAIALEAIKP